MDMNSDTTWWWIASGALIAIELGTGTFYLLMLALGTVAAAIASHLGLGASAQMISAAVVGGGAVIAWHIKRLQQQRQEPQAGANRNVNLDIGEKVEVAQWNPDGTTRIKYRGASWAARYIGSDAPQPGAFIIREIEGSQLLLGR